MGKTSSKSYSASGLVLIAVGVLIAITSTWIAGVLMIIAGLIFSVGPRFMDFSKYEGRATGGRRDRGDAGTRQG